MDALILDVKKEHQIGIDRLIKVYSYTGPINERRLLHL